MQLEFAGQTIREERATQGKNTRDQQRPLKYSAEG